MGGGARCLQMLTDGRESQILFAFSLSKMTYFLRQHDIISDFKCVIADLEVLGQT